MGLAEKQRAELIKVRGEPKLTIEFDVFEELQVSMWTHFNHGDNFEDMRSRLIAIRNHLDEFLKDENMCPFRTPTKE